MLILLNGWILPFGGVASERACDQRDYPVKFRYYGLVFLSWASSSPFFHIRKSKCRKNLIFSSCMLARVSQQGSEMWPGVVAVESFLAAAVWDIWRIFLCFTSGTLSTCKYGTYKCAHICLTFLLVFWLLQWVLENIIHLHKSGTSGCFNLFSMVGFSAASPSTSSVLPSI